MLSTGGCNCRRLPRTRDRNFNCWVVAWNRAASSDSAAMTGTPIMEYGRARVADGLNRWRYRRIAAMPSGEKWPANENGRPSSAAMRALKSLEPSSQIGMFSPSPGMARTGWPGRDGARYARNSSTSAGNSRPLRGLRRSACCVAPSLPGARPRPRSMRPGYRVSSVPNCSAMISGA
ncbi:hypothetical protein D3C85_1298300 [compost metagenome]